MTAEDRHALARVWLGESAPRAAPQTRAVDEARGCLSADQSTHPAANLRRMAFCGLARGLAMTVGGEEHLDSLVGVAVQLRC